MKERLEKEILSHESLRAAKGVSTNYY